MNKRSLFAGLLLCSSTAIAQQYTDYKDNWMRANNAVVNMSQSGNTMYMTGTFTAFTHTRSNGTPLGLISGAPNSAVNNVPNGNVYTSVPDGAGGWYIGGVFTSVGGVTRNRVARVNADGSLHAWNPNCNQEVYSLAVNNGTVYIGGLFGQIGGQSRSNIAAVDTATGALKAWNVGGTGGSAGGAVTGIDVVGSTVYFSGYFEKVRTIDRYHVAAVDTGATFTLRPFSPVINNTVGKIVVQGSTAYVTGAFTTVNGVTRNQLAAVDTGTGALGAWDPNIGGGAISDLKPAGKTLYIAGSFTTVGGVTRSYLAGIDTAGTGTLTNFAPNPGAAVSGISLRGSIIYAGGYFTTMKGGARNRAAALDTTGAGTLLGWNPGFNNAVYTVAASTGGVYAGGTFTGATIPRASLAAMDVTTGELLPWRPAASSVSKLLASDNTVYVAGAFTTIGGQSRRGLAAINAADTGTVKALQTDVNANGSVLSMVLCGSTLFVSGDFTTIGGIARNRLAAIDTNGAGTVKAWNPSAGISSVYNAVYSITRSGSTIYAGGDFTSVGGVTRNRLAAIDTTGVGTVKAWNPNANDFVIWVTASGNTIYAGGNFTTIGGVTRNRAAAIDSTGNLKAWNPNADNTVYCIVPNGAFTYLSGPFSTLGGVSRSRIASLDTVGVGTLKAFNPNANTQVSHMVVDGSKIYAGGFFTGMNGNTTRSRFMALVDSVALCTPIVTSTVTPTSCVGVSDGAIGLTVTGGYTPYTYTWTGAGGFSASTKDVTGLAAGSYSVTVTSTGGCTASITGIAMTATPPVVPTVSIVSPVKICYLSQSAFTATGTSLGTAPIYTWHRNGVEVPDTTTATYITSNISKYGPEIISVTVGNINGCVTTDELSFTDTVQALNPLDPNTNYTTASGISKLCEGDAVTFTSKSENAAGATFSWARNGQAIAGATTASYTTALAGDITATVTSAEGCVRSATRTINTLPLAEVVAMGDTMLCPGASVMLEATPVMGATYRWKQGAVNRGAALSQSANAAGAYTVTVTKNLCAATSAPINVSIKNPDLSVMASAVSVCSPDSIVLSAVANPAYAYTWYKSSAAVGTGSAYTTGVSGSYSVGISYGGCAEKKSTAVAVTATVTPVASIAFLTKQPSYWILRASPTTAGHTYEWYRNDTLIADSVRRDLVVSRNGNYKVVATKGMCPSAMSAPFVVNSATFPAPTARMVAGVTGESAMVNVFPNPSTGIFNIGSEQPVDIVVKDVQGRVIVDVKNASSVDLSGQAAGMYMMSIMDAEGKLMQVERVVKQ
jgi:hypothetical protein